MSMRPQPFQIDVGQPVLDDLQMRLQRSRWTPHHGRSWLGLRNQPRVSAGAGELLAHGL